MDTSTAGVIILERFNGLFGDDIQLAADKSYCHNLVIHPDGKINFHFKNN